MRVAGLEQALDTAKQTFEQMKAFAGLKAERDALRRAIRSGEIWLDTKADRD